MKPEHYKRINKLLSLLTHYLRQHTFHESFVKNLKTIYNSFNVERIPLQNIQRILIEPFKDDDVREFSEKNNKELERITQKMRIISSNLANENYRLSQEEKYVSFIEQIIEKLKQKQQISHSEIVILANFFDTIKINENEQLQYIRAIEAFNVDHFSRKNEFYESVSREKDSFFEYGYETMKKCSKPIKSNIDLEIEGYIHCLKTKKNDQDLMEILPSLSLEFYTKEQLQYIFYKISLAISNEIYELIVLLKKKENYCDKTLREMIVDEIHLKQQLQLDIYHYYDEILLEQDLQVNGATLRNFQNIENVLLFAHSSNNANILNDISSKGFTKEYLSKVKKLLIGFQNGTLGHNCVKVAPIFSCTKGKNHIILSDFQVRILCQRLSGKYVVVKGAGIIQTGFDARIYDSLANRKTIDITKPNKLQQEMAFSEDAFQKVIEYCEEYGRIGTR